jgi:surface antigen
VKLAVTRRTDLGTNVLASGSSIWPGQYLKSPNGRFRLKLQTDGNLVLYDTSNGSASWSTGVASGVVRATMQTDGNFVIVRSSGSQWSSTTQGFGGARLIVQDDGNVVVQRKNLPVWSRFSGYRGNRLTEGLTLAVGDYLLSADRRFKLVMQGDGNLVEYEVAAGRALWASSTFGSGAYAALQGDGNFVVYQGGQARWASNTAQFPDVQVHLQNDGNVVAYSQGLPAWAARDGYLGGRLAGGWRLDPGDIRLSPNHRYRLVMQGDGNLVLYDGGRALWATSTSGDNYAVMQSDGNLVVYRRGGGALWASNTGGKTGSRLQVQDDGNLVIYQGGTAIWSRMGSALERDVDAFVQKYNGNYWDFDGAYGAQCVDLFQYYQRDVIHGSPMWGDAHELWTHPAADTYYAKVSSSATPRKGDVAVWSSSLPHSGGAGHVAIVLESINGSTIRVIEQNSPQGNKTAIDDNSTAYLLGYLRPKRQ